MTPLARELKCLEMSQSELARRTKLHRATISRYVDGSRTPSLATAYSIARVLKCEPFKLFPQRRRAGSS